MDSSLTLNDGSFFNLTSIRDICDSEPKPLDKTESSPSLGGCGGCDE